MTTVVRMHYGSHVHGTNVPESDRDFKAVHIPPARDILLQRVQDIITASTKNDSSDRNTAEDEDFESHSLQRFFTLLLEGHAVALSMLFTPDRWIIERTPLWDRICGDRRRWLMNDNYSSRPATTRIPDLS